MTMIRIAKYKLNPAAVEALEGVLTSVEAAAIQPAPCNRLAAINTTLNTNHADLDTALAALLDRHGEVLGALVEAREALEDALCVVQGGPIHREINDALAAIAKVSP